MSGFIRVLGDDADYKGRKAPMFVAISDICTVQPLWAVEKDGEFWACTYDYKEGKIVSYLLVDFRGNKYSCGSGELQKLGIEIDSLKPKIGFLLGEDDEKTAVEVS